MATRQAIEQAIQDGQQSAQQIYLRSVRPAALGAPPFQGYLLAEGDSWFDYPAFQDIAEALEDDYGYKVKSAAHHGDTVTDMAYDPSQLRRLQERFQDMKDANRKPRAIILSGGGNDVVDALAVLLNHRGSGLAPVNASVEAGVLHEQIPLALGRLIGAVKGLSQQHFGEVRPILLHGYAAPVPDGRGYPILGLSGPWLKPAFARRGWVTQDPQPDPELVANAQAIAGLIDTFNDQVLPAVAAAAGASVTHVDVRSALRSDLASYRQDWRDEMHATGSGFKAVATLFDAAIRAAAPTIP
jgi:lysophospholipase L1-like esterase